MKTIDQQLGRLLRAAARSSLAREHATAGRAVLTADRMDLPFTMEARVLAAWRLNQAVADLFIPRLFKRATCLAALIMLVSVLWNLPALVHSSPLVQDISESVITFANLP